MTKYLEDLNDRQRAGVEATHGPVLVIAGAGSGKTKMLTTRIVHLMTEHQIPGRNILAVTFTNKAAGEMRERASRALGMQPGALDPPPPYFTHSHALLSQPTIGTFHSVCARILRREIERTPFKQQFVIYDDSDQLSLVKECFGRLGISDKSFSPKSFQHSINAAKCQAHEAHEIEGREHNPYAKNLSKVYELYQQELFKNNAIDFGEIITLTYRLLRDNADILEKYQDHYRFIHVDEYQDTNRAQYLLVRLLASKYRNLCVVGDEDQSIYKWRGADIRNILDFEKDYPDAAIVKLEQNYRSTQTIINASSRVISNNSSRKAKTLWTENATGEKILRARLPDDRGEAEFVVSRIKNECATQGYAFSDAAIFYRTNAQSRVLEDVLRREKIPYKIVGGLRFYDRKEIKDVLAYFRVLFSATDAMSFKRVINVPHRAIGKATVEKVEEMGFARGMPFEQALREATLPTDATLSGAPKRKVGEFLHLIDELRGRLTSLSLSELYHELLDRTRYVDELRQENTEESLSRIENLQEFDSMLVEFEEDQVRAVAAAAEAAGAEATVPRAAELLPVFLENITLAGESQPGASEAAGTVSLMTLHTSKGLEFPLVFMVGLEEGLFPSIRPFQEESEEDIEEERRLCYVGMTRAKRKLYMTYAVCRRVYGNIVYHDPARFFMEIPSEYVEAIDLTQRMRHDTSSTGGGGAGFQPRSGMGGGIRIEPVVEDGDGPRIGIRVRHGTYGVGIIRGMEGSNQDAKVTVEFSGQMVKKFVLKFANLEYLG